MTIIKRLKNLIWRTQFKIVKIDHVNKWAEGRCLDCEANGKTIGGTECAKYYCPCKYNEHLKRVAYYGWLYKKKPSE